MRAGFGCSDRAKVYLNGRLLYAGDNGYASRDYRHLGTQRPPEATGFFCSRMTVAVHVRSFLY